MLVYLNRDKTLEMFKETISSRSNLVGLTGTEEMYKKMKKDSDFSKVLFGSSMGGIPSKTFGIAFVEQFVVSTEVNLMKLFQIVNGGVVFPYTLFWPLEKFISNVEAFRETLEEEERIREIREKMKEEYKKKLEEYKKQKKEIKEKNKALKEEYKKALKEAPESVKAFIQEPEYLPEPEKPKEPNYPEFRKGYSLLTDRQDQSFGWKLLARFEFYKIKDSSLGFLKRREELLAFNTKNVFEVAEIKEISKGEFYEMLKKLDIDTPKVNDLKQQLVDSETISIVAEEDQSFEELLFSEEEEGVKEMRLPPLAPIKPMHAASMLAGGIGEYSKELILDGEKVLIKAAIVKEFKTRKTIVQNKEVEEVVEFYEQKMGVYNIDRRDLKILG